MREVDEKDYTFGNDEYLSVFVGVCESQELLDKYLKQDYELLQAEYIGSEFGVDFNINYYDEDYSVFVVNSNLSKIVEDIFAKAMVFDIDLLKHDYPDKLDRLYNAAIVIGKLKYEGEVKEIQNNQFGFFKFLGVYTEE